VKINLPLQKYPAGIVIFSTSALNFLVENQEWPEDDSIVIDEPSNEQGPRSSRINTVLRKTKSQIRGLIDLGDKKSQGYFVLNSLY